MMIAKFKKYKRFTAVFRNNVFNRRFDPFKFQMDYNDGNMREQAIDTIEKLEAAFGQLRAADYQERLIKLIGQLESMRVFL